MTTINIVSLMSHLQTECLYLTYRQNVFKQKHFQKSAYQQYSSTHPPITNKLKIMNNTYFTLIMHKNPLYPNYNSYRELTYFYVLQQLKSNVSNQRLNFLNPVKLCTTQIHHLYGQHTLLVQSPKIFSIYSSKLSMSQIK